MADRSGPTVGRSRAFTIGYTSRQSTYEQGGHVRVIVKGEGAYVWDDQGL